MLIEELSTQESEDLLARSHLGRLACAQGCQPYVVPIHFAYHDSYLYSFSTIGKKIEWMRDNPLVCVETDEIASTHQWTSVIVVARYEELLDTAEWRSECELAWNLLQQRAMWWEPGYAKAVVRGRERSLIPIFYRLHVSSITGRRGTLETGASAERAVPMIETVVAGRLQRILRSSETPPLKATRC